MLHNDTTRLSYTFLSLRNNHSSGTFTKFNRKLGLANALGGALPPTRAEKAAGEATDKPKAETPPAKDEPGLDAAVADLVEEEAKPAPDRRR